MLLIMPDPSFPLPATLARAEHVFPTLSTEQIARVSSHGRLRAIRAGEILVNAGDHLAPFFVVTTGEIEVIRPSSAAAAPIVVHRPVSLPARPT